jgi:hypothetical protein
MSWNTMSLELSGQVPVPYPFCKTLVQRAYKDVQGRYIWSFLWGLWPIYTPAPISAGTFTTTLGSNEVTADANASAAITGLPEFFPVTVRQFRVGQGTIYNIIAADYTVPTAVVLTLDKIYVDPTVGAGQVYSILGVYYNAPVSDFLWWESITDPQSGYTFKTTLTREYVDRVDPQRFQAGWPIGVIPYQVNPWAGNFYGYPMYEIWPAPLNGYTYVGSGFRKGTGFSAVTDEVNPALGEDVVIELAKAYAYEWCEANRDKVPAASAKADFRYLIGKARKAYGELIDDYIRQDAEFSHRHIIPSGESEFYGMLPWVSEKAGFQYVP